ncbi:MAG: hypothetical protein WHV67_00425 [Thermoanaerobaculia bacterium]
MHNFEVIKKIAIAHFLKHFHISVGNINLKGRRHPNLRRIRGLKNSSFNITKRQNHPPPFILIFFIYTFFSSIILSSQLIPVVANSPGAQGSYWITDLSLSNPHLEDLNITLSFFKTGVPGNPVKLNITLKPNEVKTFENILEQMGVENATGAIEIESEKNIAITARTYNIQGEDELGQGMKGYLDYEMLKTGEKATFCSPKSNDEYRFNFGVYAKENSRIKFDIYTNGNLAESITKEFSPELHIQQDAKTFFGIELKENSGIIAEMLAGKAYLYASTVQNKSGDGSFEEMNKIQERALNIPQEEDRFFFYDETFKGKMFRDIIRENAEALGKILSHGYYYDVSYEGNDPNREKKIYLTAQQWKDLLLEMTDGEEAKTREFRELYIFDEMIFPRFWEYAKMWEIKEDAENWIVFADYQPTKGDEERYEKGIDLVVQGLSEQDIDDFNNIIYPFIFEEKNAEIIVPVVANTAGAQGSYWKSDLWLFNPYDEEIRGKIFFKPSGISTPDEQGMDFSIGAKQVIQYTNFPEMLGVKGAGAAKIQMQGTKAPKVKVSTYNQIGEKELMQGMNGFALEELLTGGEKAHLIGVKDISKYRFNIGVYAEQESEIIFEVYDEFGNKLYETTKQFPEKYHIQQDAKTFLGIEVPANARITAKMNSGKAKIYGSGIQNNSGDGYWQDAIVLSRNNTAEEEKRSYIFAHDKIFNGKPFWQTMQEHKDELAELFASRENILSYIQGSSPKHSNFEWWQGTLHYLYDNDFSQRFEARDLLFNQRTKKMMFTDYAMGGHGGQDLFVIGFTEKDLADIVEFFEKYTK